MSESALLVIEAIIWSVGSGSGWMNLSEFHQRVAITRELDVFDATSPVAMGLTEQLPIT